jgi:pyruvate/2-oxoglutarate dehydrogenase complex dihydrolipoamide dehydrogenase (E3) component
MNGVRMSDQMEFDVVVVGAGPTGENVADRVVKKGLSAVVVESELVGGDCSYWACMPSKALLRPGHALSAAQRVGGSRQAVTGKLDVAAVLERRDTFTHNWDDASQVSWLEGAGIALVRGVGRLVGERRVDVETSTGTVQIVARQAVALATGSVPALPPIPGLAASRPWTTKDATGSKEVPSRLIVLGGGVAGCELAQAYSSLGSRVTLVEKSDRLLSIYESVVGEMLLEGMQALGIDVRTNATATRAERRGDSTVAVTLDSGELIEGDELLVAAGRQPRTNDLGLETVGLEPGSWLEVDDTMTVRSVSGNWLYAPGDVNHRVLLTHQGKYQARVCGDVIAGRAKGGLDELPWGRFMATADHRSVPQVIFTDPEIASVGYSQAQATSAGIRVRVVDYSTGQVAGASLHEDDYRGLARLIIDEERQVIVGATFIGSDSGEMLHAATIAIVGEVPLDRLWHAVPSYPTISEVWLRLLEAYGL